QPAHHRSHGQTPGNADGTRDRYRRQARQHLVRLGAAGAGRSGAFGQGRARPAAAARSLRRRLYLGLGAAALLSSRQRHAAWRKGRGKPRPFCVPVIPPGSGGGGGKRADRVAAAQVRLNTGGYRRSRWFGLIIARLFDLDHHLTASQLAFVFPGQGSQSSGMLADLAARGDAVRATFAEASEGAGIDLWALSQDADAGQLNRTEFTQPALLAA